MRLVLDTDVVVAAMRSPGGASAELLRLLDAGRGNLFLSVALALEYEAVCRSHRHRTAAGLDDLQVVAFIDGLIALATPIEVFFRWRPRLRDPGDELVLEAAVNGGAQAIVTFNQRDFLPGAAEFGIGIMRPAEMLGRLRP